MKLLVSRVKYADILIDNNISKGIKRGLLVYISFSYDVDDKTMDRAILKLLNLRFFEDDTNRLKKSLIDENLEILLVSNFSLYAGNKKGTSLDFSKSQEALKAQKQYDKFLEKLKKAYSRVECGKFGSDMQITSLADGPLNVILEY